MLKPIQFRRAFRIVIIIIVVVVIGILVKKYTRGESFNFLSQTIENDDHVQFFNKKEACELFRTDPDSYFENLTDMDRHAMKIQTVNEAIEKMCIASRSFTPEEQVKIVACTQEADRWLRAVKMPYFDGNKCANLRWKLVLTVGRANEEGMPHTKGDVIYLSDSVISDSRDQLTAVLIHEKVHVYERTYPALMEQWMKWAGYKPHRRQSDIYTARSNPDVDGWTYLDPKGKETVVLYNATLRSDRGSREESFDRRHLRLSMFSSLPSTILDATYPHGDDPASEHPYEMLAYTLDHMYTKDKRAGKI